MAQSCFLLHIHPTLHLFQMHVFQNSDVIFYLYAWKNDHELLHRSFKRQYWRSLLIQGVRYSCSKLTSFTSFFLMVFGSWQTGKQHYNEMMLWPSGKRWTMRCLCMSIALLVVPIPSRNLLLSSDTMSSLRSFHWWVFFFLKINTLSP